MAKKDIIISTNIANLSKRLEQLNQIDTLIYHNKKHPLKVLDEMSVGKFNYYTPIPENRQSSIRVFGWITTDGNCPTLLVGLPPCHKFHNKSDSDINNWSWQVYRHGYSFTVNKKIQDIECLKEKVEKNAELEDYWVLGCTYSLSSDYQAITECEYKEENYYYGCQRRVWTMADLHKELRHMIDNFCAQMTVNFWNDYYRYVDEQLTQLKRETEMEFEELPF